MPIAITGEQEKDKLRSNSRKKLHCIFFKKYTHAPNTLVRRETKANSSQKNSDRSGKKPTGQKKTILSEKSSTGRKSYFQFDQEKYLRVWPRRSIISSSFYSWKPNFVNIAVVGAPANAASDLAITSFRGALMFFWQCMSSSNYAELPDVRPWIT